MANEFPSRPLDLFFVSGDTGWISGGGGGTGIMRTINGGFTWIPVNTPTPYGDAKIFMIDNKRGWVGSAFNVVVSTRDGFNWGYQNTPPGNHYSVFFLDSLNGWAGRNNLIKTDDGGGLITSVSNNVNIVPDEFVLHQNYPNPFNPVTVIRYSLKENSLTTLKVFDVLGIKVTTLVNENQNAGSHSIKFNADDYTLSSGIYFYTLFANNNLVATKSMLLIK
ncbi:MAG: T9SS type A sorting domain-containing protein [Ignavibacteria bacterium]|nr:T9SS type A sorting domain-containing protein [Ignavibacteria bacterium]